MHAFFTNIYIYIYIYHAQNNTRKVISLRIILKWPSVCTRKILFQSTVGHEEEIAPSSARQLVVKFVINLTMFETFICRYVARLLMSKSERAETHVL